MKKWKKINKEQWETELKLSKKGDLEIYKRWIPSKDAFGNYSELKYIWLDKEDVQELFKMIEEDLA